MEGDVIKLKKQLANEEDIVLLSSILSNDVLKNRVESLEKLIKGNLLTKYEVNYFPERHNPNFNYILEFSDENKTVKPYVTFFYTPQGTYASFGVKNGSEAKSKFDNLDKKLYIIGKDENSNYINLIEVNSVTSSNPLFKYSGNEIDKNHILVVPLEKKDNYVTKILLYSPSYQKVRPLLKGKNVNLY